MIIKTSSMHMSMEHEKVESVVTSGALNSATGSDSFGFQLQQAEASIAQARLQLVAGVVGSLQEQEMPQTVGSMLIATPEGLKFRAAEERDEASTQESVIRARLWQSLLQALNPDTPPLVSVDGLIPTDKAPAAIPAEGDGRIELTPITMSMQFRVSETVSEYECTSFGSCGSVTTADGRSIDFDLSLTMERSFIATREYQETREVVFTDPLILNFEGNYADLTDEKYEFDLDADGNTELISYLAGKSGMLALDRNSDGVINDGSELFGAQTGNGFAELAEYDEDSNGYIDEADSIFDQLLIWRKGLETDALETLKEQDVGAIYLGSTATPFDIKGQDNQHNGRVTDSGVYFTEAGEVGTLQQIDMVV